MQENDVNDVETQLIRKFAPQVYLYSQDKFRPSSVPWILQHAELRGPLQPWHLLAFVRKELLPVGQVTPTTLVSQSFTEGGNTIQSGYTYNSNVLNPPVTDFALYFPGQGRGDVSDILGTPPEGSPLYGQPLQRNPNNLEQWLCTAPCYAHYRKLNTNFASYAITYCFFYPFNGSSAPASIDIGIHVGDWERVTVYVSSDQTHVAAVFFATHGSGTWAFPGQFELVQDEVGYKTHVVVFSANGGHPSYPTPGKHTNLPLAPDLTDHGPSWPTWKTVVNVGDIYTATGPTLGNEWLKYSGRWGTTHPPTGDSPPTPTFQSWWHGEENEQKMLSGNGAFQHFLLQTGTPIEATDGANNFAYWGLADYNGDGIPDLFGVKVRNTGSGRVEVHVLDGAKNFQSFLLQTPTALLTMNAADFIWSIANTGSPKPPLYGIKINHSDTNTAEVHVLDGAQNYEGYLLHHGTAIGASDAAQNYAAWDVSYTTGSKQLSLFCVKVRNTGTGMVEIHILDGSKDFEHFLFEHGTALTQADGATNYSSWAVADYQRNGYFDLFGIKVRNTIIGKVEVHILDGHNALESFVLQAATPIATDDGANNFGGWAVADYNRDGIPDLFAIKVRNTGTNMVEVHVLNGAPK